MIDRARRASSPLCLVRFAALAVGLVCVGVLAVARPLPASAATPRARIGAVIREAIAHHGIRAAISYMSTLLLRLVDEGKVRLTDKISRWLPNLPDADHVTLGMLARMTAGYHDYVLDPLLTKMQYANPFGVITTKDQLRLTFDAPLQLTPGTNLDLLEPGLDAGAGGGDDRHRQPDSHRDRYRLRTIAERALLPEADRPAHRLWSSAARV